MDQIIHVKITKDRLVEIIEDLYTDKYSDHELMLGCVGLAIVLQDPMLTTQQVQDGIKEVTNHMAAWICSQGKVDPKEVN